MQDEKGIQRTFPRRWKTSRQTRARKFPQRHVVNCIYRPSTMQPPVQRNARVRSNQDYHYYFKLFEMRTWMMSLAHFPCCLLLATVVIGTSIIHAEPEPMARLTRPKVFGSPEEFKKYANLVKDYFFALGKARFGKRGDIAIPMSTELSNWEILRMIQNAQRQKKIRQNKEVLFHDFQSSDIDKHTSSVPARPGSLSDMINNYDDVQ